MVKLSIIIPAYNEVACLATSVHDLVQYLKTRYNSLAKETEIILVIDGATDETSDIALQLAEVYPNLQVLVNFPNKGKGFSVRQGMLAANGEKCVFMDADLSTPLGMLDRMLTELDDYPCVIGSRGLPSSVIERNQPVFRRLSGFFFRMNTKLLLHLPYEDTQCGFKGFQIACAKTIFAHDLICGFAFDVEVLLLAHLKGYRVKEMGVSWHHVGQSSVHLKRGIEAFRELIRLRRNYLTVVTTNNIIKIEDSVRPGR
jgi:dolichyl-phosphate beta-glucosyltransferase